VVASYPHDPSAFTEGLFILDGRLFESTGLEGKSEIREVELTTGAVKRRRPLDAKYFGEGIVAFGGTLYQLTWKGGKAFTYDLATFAPRPQTFSYAGEGWGLTTDGTSLIQSDGTARITFRDPKTFAVTRTIDVHDGPSPVSQLNELEWVKGEILANVWQSTQIVRIDPKDGAVTGWVDLGGVLGPADRTGREDVMNGIAYDARTDKLYVTGKYYSRLYEVRLDKR
jgi:glutamine cyclotransferase